MTDLDIRDAAALDRAMSDFQSSFAKIEQEVAKSIVGMHDIVRGVVSSVCARGHVLLEGVPGLGKTLLVKSIAQTLGLSFKRVQFTPDLMPSDVTTGSSMVAKSGSRTALAN